MFFYSLPFVPVQDYTITAESHWKELVGSTSGQAKFRLLACMMAVVTLQFPPHTSDNVCLALFSANGLPPATATIKCVAAENPTGPVIGSLSFNMTKVGL